MPKKNETPVAVRVARWAAIAATVTALGTIGNTFIEKRPWFLGGEDEKTAIVVPRQVVSVPPTHYEATNIVKFSIPAEGETVSVNVVSVAPESAQPTSVASYNNTPMVMSAVPDMGWETNILNFILYRPISFWVITGSTLLLAGYSFVEFFYRRKKKEQIMFDSSPR